MKKILILSNNLQPGGAERQLVYLAQALSLQHEVAVMVYEKKGIFVDVLEKSAIPILSVKRRGIWKSARELRKIVRKNKYDVVVSYLPECNLISELATLPIKRWRVIAGARSANPKFVTNPRLRLYYYAHLFADVVISNSETNKKDILKVNKLLGSNKVQVVYNVFNSTQCRTHYVPFKDGKINISIAANYRSVKNLDGVLKALVLLSEEKRKRIHIDWYGLEIDDTYAKGQCFIHSNGLDEVICLNPSTDKVLDVYNEADVVGLFSHFEGLPNSLCEALMLGKMVICTPVSDMPSLLKNTDNIVCRSDSIDDIYEGLKRLIKMPHEDIMSTGGRNAEFFAKVFDKDTIEQQLLKVVLG